MVHGGVCADNLYSQFSATCFYFAVALTDQARRQAAERDAATGVVGPPPPPLGLIQSSIGGSMIEAWMPDSALDSCKNESLAGRGQAPPSRLFNGMIARAPITTLSPLAVCCAPITTLSPHSLAKLHASVCVVVPAFVNSSLKGFLWCE